MKIKNINGFDIKTKTLNGRLPESVSVKGDLYVYKYKKLEVYIEDGKFKYAKKRSYWWDIFYFF